jgi:hypothetical protein
MTKAKLFMTGGSQAVRVPPSSGSRDRKLISGAILSQERWCHSLLLQERAERQSEKNRFG